MAMPKKMQLTIDQLFPAGVCAVGPSKPERDYDVDVSLRQGHLGLPRRGVDRPAYPEPHNPVATSRDPVLLQAVLDGLSRMDTGRAAR